MAAIRHRAYSRGMSTPGAPALVAACLAFVACQAPSSTVVAPEGEDNVYVWLAAQYDADGDGSITPEEFDRDGAEYARLDRNEDGVIDATDYPTADGESSRGDWNAIPASFKERMDAMYAGRSVMLTYFQPDPQATELSRDALLVQFDALDTNRSEDIDESEFACATDPQPWGGPGKAWPLLVAAVDTPGNSDQRLGRDELTEYHGKFANDEGVTRGGPAKTTQDGDRTLASDGAPVGVMAPDFVLDPLGGGEPVALSYFQNERPVALIFGSYT